MEDPVLKLLNDNKLSYTVSGKDYLIKCLNPEHEDSNPSLRVDKLSGIAHCFACGWKRNLFRHYGILTSNASIKVQKLKEKLKELKAPVEVEYPSDNTPYRQVFRGISVATLRYFEAFYTHSVEKLEDRIVFPIKDVSGKVIAFVGRHVLSDANPKYVNYPSGVSLNMLPAKLEELSSNLVIVEGIFDMLNLWDNGVRNVSCAFGTQSLAYNTSMKLLPFKAQGVSKIFILFDGDTAGRKAAKDLEPIIEKEGFSVEIIDLPDDRDPGDLDKEEIAQIREYTK